MTAQPLYGASERNTPDEFPDEPIFLQHPHGGTEWTEYELADVVSLLGSAEIGQGIQFCGKRDLVENLIRHFAEPLEGQPRVILVARYDTSDFGLHSLVVSNRFTAKPAPSSSEVKPFVVPKRMFAGVRTQLARLVSRLRGPSRSTPQ